MVHTITELCNLNFDNGYMCGSGTEVQTKSFTKNPTKMKLFQEIVMDTHSCHVVVQILFLYSGLKPTSCSNRDIFWCKSNLGYICLQKDYKNQV